MERPKFAAPKPADTHTSGLSMHVCVRGELWHHCSGSVHLVLFKGTSLFNLQLIRYTRLAKEPQESIHLFPSLS